VRRADNLTTFMCRLSRNSWTLSKPGMGLLYLYRTNDCEVIKKKSHQSSEIVQNRVSVQDYPEKLCVSENQLSFSQNFAIGRCPEAAKFRQPVHRHN
jgi:hypothetical protein